MTIDQQLETRQSRRMHAQSRALDRLSIREEKADRMIGELADGRCYVYPVGGQYREGTRAELVAYLIRRNYA